MTLNDRKGNIRGREFPTDTGIDGNACEETTKDQRWVGLCRQIPDTDTHNQPLSFSLSVSFLSLPLLVLSLSYTTRAFFLSLSLFPPLHRLVSPLLSLTSVHSFVRFARSCTRVATFTATTHHRFPTDRRFTMGIRSGAGSRGNNRGNGERATTSFTHGPLSYDSRYFEKHQAHPYQVNNINITGSRQGYEARRGEGGIAEKGRVGFSCAS